MENKDLKLEQKNRRVQAWVTVWAATASASNCTRTSDATKYADEMLVEYDKRFPISE